MSGRKLGGGRILGSGKGLAPPKPSSSSSSPAGGRPVSPFPPRSESTGSIASSSVSQPATGGSSLPDLGEGLGAMISVGAQGKGSGADASALVCPICSEEMVTLLQLNRHIDDTHQELPEEEQDEVKTWFDKQVSKAKRFQPLSLIHQKLRGLDVFESNESAPIAPAHHHGHTSSVSSITAGKAPAEGPIDPDELITRKHWQRTTSDDYCTDPTCRKSLGPIVGSINCRHCGKLFCEEHTMYQMKLSRSAQHEPVRGYWARVCETCYKSREGYNDHTGHVVDHTASFLEMRRKRVERHTLEVSRLEKRLTKLTRLLANPPERLLANTNGGSLLAPMSISGQKNQKKLLEQTVVTWEDDNSVIKCPFCQQEFGSWTFRRHHCRICGKVVCADPQTGCSSEVSLTVDSEHTNATSEKPPAVASPGQLSVEVRMCSDCNHTIFASREFAASLLHKSPDQRAYETLRQFERGILQLLPYFHRALLALQPEASSEAAGGGVDLSRPPPTHAQIQEAAKMRKRLIDAFAKYGAAAKRMRDLPAEGPGQKRLQTAVYTYASGFLHTNMLPLKSLPQLLRSSSSTSSRTSRLLSSSQHSSSNLINPSNLRHAEFASDSGSESKPPNRSHLVNGSGNAPPSETDDGASTVVSQLETEEKELRERLIILEEQLFMVEQMTQVATKARRFEEVSALSRNREELEGEIKALRGKVGDVEVRWEGVYQNGTTA